MSGEDQGDRTELPTPKRLREAREKGDVPRSRELGNVAVLGVASLAMLASGPMIGQRAQVWLRESLQFDAATLGRPETLLAHSASVFLKLLIPFTPVIAAALIACLISPMVMAGLRFSQKALKPDFKRMNPLSGIKRMVGKESWMELVRSLLRVAIVGGVAFIAIRGMLDTLLGMPGTSLEVASGQMVGMVKTVLIATIAALGLIALIDVPWQHYQYREKLKMTKQQVRDEFKEMEGNPEVKARARQVARQIANQKMMEALPGADVVIVNPTHYSVAIKYDPATMRAPKVIARGVDEMALTIRQVAAQHRITVLESPPLARALYRQVKLDQEIPVKLYAAVAQVLTYLHQLRAWAPGRGYAHPVYAPLDVGADGAPDEAHADGIPS